MHYINNKKNVFKEAAHIKQIKTETFSLEITIPTKHATFPTALR